MYFRNYRHQKAWLDKCLKGLVSENHLTGNEVNGSNTVSIATKALLSYSLTYAKVIELERVSHSGMENLKAVC